MQLQRQSAELAAYFDESEVRNLTSRERENELKKMRSADPAGGTSKVDVLKHPLRAMQQGVRVTPTLAKLSPGPIANVVGNLSDKLKVLIVQ
jgi:hypothetical protein